MLRVGLLGAGRIGQVHAVNIAGHSRSTLAAVADIDGDAALYFNDEEVAPGDVTNR